MHTGSDKSLTNFLSSLCSSYFHHTNVCLLLSDAVLCWFFLSADCVYSQIFLWHLKQFVTKTHFRILNFNFVAFWTLPMLYMSNIARVDGNEFDKTCVSKFWKIWTHFSGNDGRVWLLAYLVSLFIFLSKYSYFYRKLCLEETFPDVCYKTNHPIKMWCLSLRAVPIRPGSETF